MDKNITIFSMLSYFWSATCSVVGAMELNKIAILIGIILSIATFVINWLYKSKDYYHAKKLRERHYAKYGKNRHDRYL
ncbi:MAG: hypothetical protein [Bacteriophage sp.]|nr:MAG: hypothetical protein [Bacteriophage sp.]